MNILARRLRLPFHSFPRVVCRYSSTKTSEDLRILFCGSDDFSIASLNALYNEHLENKAQIASIDVVCRPPKRTGRGYKNWQKGTYLSFAWSLAKRFTHDSDTELSSDTDSSWRTASSCAYYWYIHWVEGVLSFWSDCMRKLIVSAANSKWFANQLSHCSLIWASRSSANS